MSYKVVMLRHAEREFDRLPEQVRARVAPALRDLVDTPRPQGVKSLKGRLRGLLRIRVGEWRVAYQVDDEQQTVCIVEIAHRSEVYERAERRQPLS